MNTEIDKESLKQIAKKEGLIFLGIVKPEYPQAAQNYLKWLQEGKQGQLSYLEKNVSVRMNPSLLLENAKSVLILGLPYQTNETPSFPTIADYAKIPDYHRLLKKKTECFFQTVLENNKISKISYRITVDTVPVLEKALAANSESGFIGKNTLFIHPKYGSYLLLSTLLTSLDLPPDSQPQIDLKKKSKHGGCGPCKQCQIQCPTDALKTEYQIDTQRCLSYWTIEHRGVIPYEFWPHLTKYYFGCDICQTACPYNQKKTHLPSPPPIKHQWDLFEVATMDQKQYEATFGGTALTRAKRSGLRRNALIALAMQKHPKLQKAIQIASEDPYLDLVLKQTIEQILSKKN